MATISDVMLTQHEIKFEVFRFYCKRKPNRYYFFIPSKGLMFKSDKEDAEEAYNDCIRFDNTLHTYAEWLSLYRKLNNSTAVSKEEEKKSTASI